MPQLSMLHYNILHTRLKILYSLLSWRCLLFAMEYLRLLCGAREIYGMRTYPTHIEIRLCVHDLKGFTHNCILCNIFTFYILTDVGERESMWCWCRLSKCWEVCV